METFPDLSGDKGRTILAMSIARAWCDDEYKRALLADPTALLEAEGIEIPPGVRVEVVENTPAVTYVPLAPRIDLAADGGRLVERLAALLPIPAGHEIRLIQHTEKTRYVIVPCPPRSREAQAAGGPPEKEETEAEVITTVETTVMNGAAAVIEATSEESVVALGASIAQFDSVAVEAAVEESVAIS